MKIFKKRREVFGEEIVYVKWEKNSAVGFLVVKMKGTTASEEPPGAWGVLSLKSLAVVMWPESILADGFNDEDKQLLCKNNGKKMKNWASAKWRF